VLASVVVSSYNYRRYLGEAIGSALAQDHRPTEVIVVDDGSTDGSPEVIAGFGDRVQAVLKENGGQASAWNAGFRACRGDAVVFLDSDDLLGPAALSRAVTAFRDPGVVKMHWPLREVDEGGVPSGRLRPAAPLARGDLSRAVARGGPAAYAWPPSSGSAWSRSFLERALPIPEEPFRVSPDLYLAGLAPLYGRVEALREAHGCWRAHGRNATWRETFRERHAVSLRQLQICFEAIEATARRLGIEADAESMRKNSWWQIPLAAEELAQVLSPGKPYILVDQDEWAKELLPSGRPLPFLERDGAYWGPPADDETAIGELERMRGQGAGHIAFGWPHLWWLEHYAGLHHHLRSRYRCVVESDRLVVFELSGGGG